MSTPATETTRPLQDGEIDGLEWRALKAKCQEAGIATIGPGRTRLVLIAELKEVMKEKREAEAKREEEAEARKIADEREKSAEAMRNVEEDEMSGLSSKIISAQNEESIAKAKYDSLVLKRKKLEHESAMKKKQKRKLLFTPMLGEVR